MTRKDQSGSLDVLSLETKSRISLRNILWATDFSPSSETALSYASALARRHGSKLYAAHVINIRTDYFGPGIPLTRLQMAERETARRMSEVAHSEGLRGIEYEHAVGLGETTDVLVRMAEDFDIDLMVLGTEGRKGIEKALMGSVAEEIIRSSPSPVLTIGPGVPVHPTENVELKRIICVTDFSPQSLVAVRLGLAWAREHSASVVLLHISEGCAAGAMDEGGRSGGAMKRLLESAIPASELAASGVEIRVEFGSAAEWILRIAEENAADLLVLGARRIEVLGGRLPRGTIYKVLREALCPLLTVTDVANSASADSPSIAVPTMRNSTGRD